MTTASRIAIVVSAIFVASCALDTDPPDLTTEPNPDGAFSLARTWYTNPDDDRYYYAFSPDGTLHHRYYQYFGSHGGGLNGFVTVIGTWNYLNEEQNSFSVGWNDSVDRHYLIVEVNETGLIIEQAPGGPVGRGLGSTDILLRSADTVTYSIPEEIAGLLGTWYYDTSREGQSLAFHEDGTCLYWYYQDFGGHLTGWVSKSGHWHYNPTTHILTITMSGEVSYHYEIDELSSSSLVMSLAGGNPGISMIYSDGQFFR